MDLTMIFLTEDNKQCETVPMLSWMIRSTLFFLLPPLGFAASLPPVTNQNGMVVSSHHIATDVGRRVLDHGGNAIDAAVAMGYALAVVDPCCGNLGGGGFMLIRLKNGENHFLNFREKAPLKLDPKIFDDQAARTKGYSSVGVPGTVMGLNTALEKFGTYTLGQAIQPAQSLASLGFRLNRHDVKSLKPVQAFFSNKPLEVGEQLRQRALATSLKSISKGTEFFYDGYIANNIIKDSGIFTAEDFQQYTVTWENSIECDYRGFHIISAPPPSSGGVALCQMLKVLESHDLKQLGFHSAASAHLNIQTMYHAFYDRNHYLGDPAFVKNPIKKLLSKAHIQSIKNKINSHHRASSAKNHEEKEKAQTTHYAVMDKQGNAVAVTYTLNGNFGAKVMAPNTGFFLNNQLDDFTIKEGEPNAYQLIQGKANLIKPGKRPLSSMSPTIVTKGKEVYLVLGAAGGSTIITTVLHLIQNIIDHDMNTQEALDAPRYHMQWRPNKTFLEPYVFSKDTLKRLKKLGHHFEQGSIFNTRYWGVAGAIRYNKNTQTFEGAFDVRDPNGSAK